MNPLSLKTSCIKFLVNFVGLQNFLPCKFALPLIVYADIFLDGHKLIELPEYEDWLLDFWQYDCLSLREIRIGIPTPKKLISWFFHCPNVEYMLPVPTHWVTVKYKFRLGSQNSILPICWSCLKNLVYLFHCENFQSITLSVAKITTHSVCISHSEILEVARKTESWCMYCKVPPVSNFYGSGNVIRDMV